MVEVVYEVEEEVAPEGHPLEEEVQVGDERLCVRLHVRHQHLQGLVGARSL